MPDKTIGEISLRGEVGFYGVTAQQFADQLSALGRVDLVKLYVNSEGGSVFDGASIYSQIMQFPARVEVIVEGLAASAASYLVQAADKISMSEFSFLMVHRASGGALGTSDDMRKTAGILDELDQQIAAVYGRKTRTPPGKWLQLMEAETWLDAEEAVAVGLATDILGSGGKPIASAKLNQAARSIATRPVRIANALDSIKAIRAASAPPRPLPPDAAEVMRFAAKVKADQLAEMRDDNRRRIVANGNKAQAMKFLKWS